MDHFYSEKIGIGYVFISQLIASGITLLLLFTELSSYKPELDTKLLKEIFLYSTPLIIVGFGGMVNETIDRFMILHMFNGTAEEARSANGIYSANYKLAVLIVIFIQTFRMGAEPFFFKMQKPKCKRKLCADHEFVCDRLLFMFPGRLPLPGCMEVLYGGK